MAKAKLAEVGASHAITQNGLLALVGYNVKRAYMIIHADFRDTLADMGVSQRTFSVLAIVAENPGVSQSDVARALGIERSGTVVIVDELEGRDLIERNKVPGDRRSYALQVTAAGLKACEQAFSAVKQHEDRLLSGLSQDERDLFRAILQRIHGVGQEETKYEIG